MRTVCYLLLGACFLLGCLACVAAMWPFLWWLKLKETSDLDPNRPGPKL